MNPAKDETLPANADGFTALDALLNQFDLPAAQLSRKEPGLMAVAKLSQQVCNICFLFGCADLRKLSFYS